MRFEMEPILRMAGRLDEEQATVDAGVLNVALTLRSELLAKVGGMLVFDVLHNGIPAGHGHQHQELWGVVDALPSFIVHLVAITGGVNNIEAEADTIFLDDYGRSAKSWIRGEVYHTV